MSIQSYDHIFSFTRIDVRVCRTSCGKTEIRRDYHTDCDHTQKTLYSNAYHNEIHEDSFSLNTSLRIIRVLPGKVLISESLEKRRSSLFIDLVRVSVDKDHASYIVRIKSLMKVNDWIVRYRVLNGLLKTRLISNLMNCCHIVKSSDLFTARSLLDRFIDFETMQ